MFKKIFSFNSTLRIFDPMPLPRAHRSRPMKIHRGSTHTNFSPFIRRISKIS